MRTLIIKLGILSVLVLLGLVMVAGFATRSFTWGGHAQSQSDNTWEASTPSPSSTSQVEQAGMLPPDFEQVPIYPGAKIIEVLDESIYWRRVIYETPDPWASPEKVETRNIRIEDNRLVIH